MDTFNTREAVVPNKSAQGPPLHFFGGLGVGTEDASTSRGRSYESSVNCCPVEQHGTSG